MHIKPKHPYFDAWIRRTRKQLSASGQLSQMAYIISANSDLSESRWREILRELIEGKIPPTLEIITQIENVLALRMKIQVSDSEQIALFSNCDTTEFE